MECPYIRIEESGTAIPLHQDVTTVGRGRFVDVQLAEPSVSMLHAEIVRRGPYLYVTDLGLSRNGTRVNGRLVARRLLADGDVVTFGSARCRVGGIAREDLSADAELRRPVTPELTRRELDVVTSLCRPALSDQAFVAPGTAREIAVDLVVTEAAVKQHLLRLYQKFRIPEGPNRRVRLANEVVALGLVRPMPPSELPERFPPAGGAQPATEDVEPPGGDATGPAVTVPAQPGVSHINVSQASNSGTTGGVSEPGGARIVDGARETDGAEGVGGAAEAGGPRETGGARAPGDAGPEDLPAAASRKARAPAAWLAGTS